MANAATGILGTARGKVLAQGQGLDEDEILACRQVPADRLPELLRLAHLVGRRWCGDAVEVEGIVSVKTSVLGSSPGRDLALLRELQMPVQPLAGLL